MKSTPAKAHYQTSADGSIGEILVLADGRIFAHNISPALAAALAELDPEDDAMRRRARQKQHCTHELSD